MSDAPETAPARTPSRSRPKSKGLIFAIFQHQLPLESETSLFILINVLDYFVTFLGLRAHLLRETNPIALWFLEGWGVIKGLLIYKLALVGLVCLISQIVATQKPGTARALLLGSSFAIGVVVIYSISLIVCQL